MHHVRAHSHKLSWFDTDHVANRDKHNAVCCVRECESAPVVPTRMRPIDIIPSVCLCRSTRHQKSTTHQVRPKVLCVIGWDSQPPAQWFPRPTPCLRFDRRPRAPAPSSNKLMRCKRMPEDVFKDLCQFWCASNSKQWRSRQHLLVNSLYSNSVGNVCQQCFHVSVRIVCMTLRIVVTGTWETSGWPKKTDCNKM